MSFPKFVFSDLSDYTLSATSTDGSYPLTNLQTYYEADQWRSASTADNQQLAIDFGAAVSIGALAIANHNFTSITSDGSISLQGADDSGFTTNVTTPTSSLKSASDPYVFTFTAVSRRYWRIFFASTIGVTPAPRLGSFFLSAGLIFPTTYEFGGRRGAPRFQTSFSRNLDGSKRGAQAFGGSKVFEIQFRFFNDTVRSSYINFLGTVRGELRPFYFADADDAVYYVHLLSDYQPTTDDMYNLNSLEKITLEEQLATVT